MEEILGQQKVKFVQAKACTGRKGVLDDAGQPVPTHQSLCVDNSVYTGVYEHDRDRKKQTIVAGIEAIFILLGRSNLSKRQDPT